MFSCIVIAGGLFLPMKHMQADMNFLTIVTIILFLFIIPIAFWKLMVGPKGEEFIIISGLSTIAGYGIVQFFSATGDLSLVSGAMCVIALILLFLTSRGIAEQKGHFEKEVEHIKKFFFGQEVFIMLLQIVVAVVFLYISGGL